MKQRHRPAQTQLGIRPIRSKPAKPQLPQPQPQPRQSQSQPQPRSISPFLAASSLGFVSLGLLAYQVIQTRLLSALFAYHYAFLVTSLAILGLGLGGLVVHLRPSLSRAFEQRPRATLTHLNLGLLGAYVFSFASVSFTPFLGSPIPYVIILMAPELVGGIVLALLFQSGRRRIGILYAADLGAAGLGCFLVVTSLDSLGFIRTWLLLIGASLLGMLVTMLSQTVKRKALWVILGMAALALPFCQSGAINHFEQQYPPYLSAPSKLLHQMNEERGPGSLNVAFTRWDSFGRTDVIDIVGEPDRKALTIDGVAYSGIYRFDGDLRQIGAYPDTAGYLPSIASLPFAAAVNDPVLLVGCGGGRDLLYALRAGAKDIDAVEINRAAIDAVRHFGDFAGHLYENPAIRVFPTDGRLFIESSLKRYEVIFLSLVKTEAATAAGMSLAENYIFTKEALAQFYDHLTESGRIAFVVHHEAALAKVVATALEVLNAKGIAASVAPQHLAVIGSKNLDPVQQVFQPLVIIKKQPYTQAEALTLLGAAEQTQNPVAYLPYYREADRLSEIHQGTRPIDQFAANLPYFAEPASDDRPFFYYFDSTTSEALWYSLAIVLVVSLAICVRPINKARCQHDALLAALMGIGFMLIEIPLIQKMGLYWGSETRSFAIVLGILLGAAGCGSYVVSANIARSKPGARLISALLVALTCAGLSLLLRREIPQVAQPGVPKALITVTLLAPLGFFMGMPFPQLVMRLKDDSEARVPLLWAVNGAAAVVGSLLAAVLAMSLGFSAVMGLGALVYSSLFLLSRAGRANPL